MLGATVLGYGDQARREVPKPDGGTGFVSLLTSRAAGPIGIHLTLAEEDFVLHGQPKLSLPRIEPPGFYPPGFQGVDL